MGKEDGTLVNCQQAMQTKQAPTGDFSKCERDLSTATYLNQSETGKEKRIH